MCLFGGFIVIDEFTLRLSPAVYILTHWHSDHYQGLTQSWTHGPIFASAITRQLLLTKFPKLENQVSTLPLRQWTTISPDVRVFAFDSNHMAGSIMVLLHINEKYYLHTGDMRFNPKIAANTPQVFMEIDSQNISKDYQCKYQIEQLHLDNTFCDPIFKFPTRSQAIRMLTELVAELHPSRLFICTDSVGKEEAFLMLSRYYKVKVAVSQARMEYIKAMDLPYRTYFTTNAEETWIEVIPKGQKEAKITSTKGSIGVTLTGWANLTHAYPDGYNSYLIPYSLHSNFREMELLVQWVRPKRLVGVVKENEGKWSSISKTNNYRGYMFSLTGIKQRGMDYLRKEYCVEKQGVDRREQEGEQNV